MPTTTQRRRPQVLVLPGGAGLTSGQRARAIAGRVGSAAGRAAAMAAAEEKHTLTALGGAAVAGFARRYGWQLPAPITGVPPVLQWGLAAWAFGRFGRSKTAAHLGTGLLSVGLYEAIAYSSRTREQVDALLETQRSEDEAESSSSRGVMGVMGG